MISVYNGSCSLGSVIALWEKSGAQIIVLAGLKPSTVRYRHFTWGRNEQT